jgi:hypothetical protein
MYIILFVCRRLYSLITSSELWYNIPTTLPSSGALNLNCFTYIGLKNQGTEGKCYHAVSRKSRKHYAIKRARVFPDHEGIPYYMMREMVSVILANYKALLVTYFSYF